MTIITHQTEANHQYNVAYEAHYIAKNLNLALELYRSIMTSHPNAPESEYCLMQINNIINSVVPKQAILDAQIDMAHKYLVQDVPSLQLT